MSTPLYWIRGPWPAQLAITSRPRGGDWLADEVAGWRRAGVGTVLSLLTADEAVELELEHEGEAVSESGMSFLSLPIPDRDVPPSEVKLTRILERLDDDLSSGVNSVIHCRQGIGRSGVVACCLLINQGLDSAQAIEAVSTACGSAA